MLQVPWLAGHYASPVFTACVSRRTFSPPIPATFMLRPTSYPYLMAFGFFLAASAFAGDAVYTTAQSERGEETYQQHCAACHGARLQGVPAAALTGEAFRGRWEDGKHTLDDLYYIIRSLMPNNAPGSLSKAQYADIAAYILRINNYPAGETELEPNAAAMKAVTLAPH